MIGRLLAPPVLTRCPRCAWSQRIRLRVGDAKVTDCELCGRAMRTTRLAVGVSVQPLDDHGVAIAYTLHVRHDQTGRWT